MKYIEAPNEEDHYQQPSIFLAGTITGAENWQLQLVDELKDEDVTIFNPRWSVDFPISKPGAARAQIEWEHKHLKLADIVSFYFPAEGLSPITLFELGKMLGIGKNIVIAVEPGFWREEDVRIQTELIRHIRIGSSLEDLTTSIKQALAIEHATVEWAKLHNDWAFE